MRKTILFLTVFLMLMFTMTGCESQRKLSDGKDHECVGIIDQKEPNVQYDLSLQNVIVGAVFVETIVVPVVVLADEFACPVSIDTSTTTAQ